MTLLWLDLETTSLNEKTGKILEVAWMFSTDDFFRTSKLRESLVSGGETELGHADQIVKNMHKQSGLWDDLATQDLLCIEDVEDLMLGDIANHTTAPPILAGSGVHFDQGWLKEHMPRMADEIHYRIFDTSTLGRFFASTGIDHERPLNMRPHRAADDVLEAYTNASNYKNEVLDLLGD